jgi:hypothetical protein
MNEPGASRKVLYLDQDVFSNLVKPEGQQYLERLRAFLQSVSASLAISINHIFEFAAIKTPASGKTDRIKFLPTLIDSTIGNLPYLQMKSSLWIYDEEFREYIKAKKDGRAVRTIEPYGAWEWMPAGGQNATVTEAVAYVMYKDAKAPKNEQYAYILEQVRDRNQLIKERVQRREELLFSTFENALRNEQNETLRDFEENISLWPKSSVIVSISTLTTNRRMLLNNFDFDLCPVINLCVNFWAYMRFRILNKKIKNSDLFDSWHAAVGCQYADWFVTNDGPLVESLNYLQSKIRMRATVTRSIDRFLDEQKIYIPSNKTAT